MWGSKPQRCTEQVGNCHFGSVKGKGSRSQSAVCGPSLVGIVGSNPPGAWMFIYCECCVCCQVEVSATRRSLVKGSSTDCDASLCVI